MAERTSPGEQVEFRVESDDAGRIDAWVAARTELSRTRVQGLIDEGRIRVGGERVLKSHALEAGDVVSVVVPPPEPLEALAEDLPLCIVYEDEELVVVDKAAGMVVHPAPGHPTGTLVNALLHHVDDLSGIGGMLRPGIVHRLDKDTSGLLVVAKSDRSHQALSEALRRREIKRLYRSVTWGHLDEDDFLIDQPIGRDPSNRKRMAVIDGGRRAVTRVRVAARWRAADMLEVALGTGRTHQIRVHLAHLGHPVVGDDLYGEGWHRGIGGRSREWARELHRRVSRQFLHAWRLAFTHPVTGERMRFEAPLPGELAEVVGWAQPSNEDTFEDRVEQANEGNRGGE